MLMVKNKRKVDYLEGEKGDRKQGADAGTHCESHETSIDR